MFRAIRRHFRDAGNGISRHFASTLSVVFAISITLLIMGVLLALVLNVSQITISLQEDVRIFVKIDNEVEDARVASLESKIKAIDGVGEVEFSSKDNELDKLKEEFGESGEMFEIYRENNPLSRAFIVYVKSGYSISQVSNQIGRIEGITEANFGGASTEQYIHGLDMVRNAGTIIVLALAALAVFLVSSTIKLSIDARETEISIMRVVGATNGYIRSPFVLEGIFIGLLGSLAPIIIMIVGYNAIYEAMGGKIITGILPLQPVFPFIGYICLALAAMGVFVGFVGSWIAVNRNLRWTR